MWDDRQERFKEYADLLKDGFQENERKTRVKFGIGHCILHDRDELVKCLRGY